MNKMTENHVVRSSQTYFQRSLRDRFLAGASWLVFAAFGLLVADTSGRPFPGVAVFCVKFGLDRLKAAFWLFRKDPNRPRARVCFLFYLGSALARIGVATVMFMILHNIITSRFFPIPAAARGRPIVDEFSEETLVCVIAMAPWFVVECFAIATSIVFKIHVWVGIEADRARELDAWPPVNLDDEAIVAPRNPVITHIYFFSVTVVIFLLLLLIVGLVSLAEVARIRRVHPFFTVAGAIFGIVSFAIAACKIVEKILVLVPSRSPNRCWSDAKSTEKTEFRPVDEKLDQAFSRDDYLYF